MTSSFFSNRMRRLMFGRPKLTATRPVGRTSVMQATDYASGTMMVMRRRSGETRQRAQTRRRSASPDPRGDENRHASWMKDAISSESGAMADSAERHGARTRFYRAVSGLFSREVDE
jgi:hypothetical protein